MWRFVRSLLPREDSVHMHGAPSSPAALLDVLETAILLLQASVYIYELDNDEVKVDKVEFSKENNL